MPCTARKIFGDPRSAMYSDQICILYYVWLWIPRAYGQSRYDVLSVKKETISDVQNFNVYDVEWLRIRHHKIMNIADWCFRIMNYEGGTKCINLNRYLSVLYIPQYLLCQSMLLTRVEKWTRTVTFTELLVFYSRTCTWADRAVLLPDSYSQLFTSPIALNWTHTTYSIGCTRCSPSLSSVTYLTTGQKISLVTDIKQSPQGFAECCLKLEFINKSLAPQQ